MVLFVVLSGRAILGASCGTMSRATQSVLWPAARALPAVVQELVDGLDHTTPGYQLVARAIRLRRATAEIMGVCVCLIGLQVAKALAMRRFLVEPGATSREPTSCAEVLHPLLEGQCGEEREGAQSRKSRLQGDDERAVPEHAHCVGPDCKNDVTGKTWFFDAVGIRALSPARRPR